MQLRTLRGMGCSNTHHNINTMEQTKQLLTADMKHCIRTSRGGVGGGGVSKSVFLVFLYIGLICPL